MKDVSKILNAARQAAELLAAAGADKATIQLGCRWSVEELLAIGGNWRTNRYSADDIHPEPHAIDSAGLTHAGIGIEAQGTRPLNAEELAADAAEAFATCCPECGKDCPGAGELCEACLDADCRSEQDFERSHGVGR